MLERDRGIQKHVYSKRERRYLSIKELLTRNWEKKILDPFTSGFVDKNDFVRTENSEGEIARAVLEYMDFLSNNDLSLTSKQKEFLTALNPLIAIFFLNSSSSTILFNTEVRDSLFLSDIIISLPSLNKPQTPEFLIPIVAFFFAIASKYTTPNDGG